MAPQGSTLGRPWRALWTPLLLGLATFLVDLPSLGSDFVYDAREEILREGFITTPGHMWDVLSLKVLSMKLMLGGRPGELLYLMLNADLWGKNPWGYHLCSNLLHATNVALLYIFLSRLIQAERQGTSGPFTTRARVATAVAVMIFALHPITVEPVSAISYSSDLLVTFFILSALIVATRLCFEPARTTRGWIALGILLTFAPVTCKESGVMAGPIVAAYWFLFRFQEAKKGWLIFLGTATLLTLAFLTARFLWAPPLVPRLDYLGGSLGRVIEIQPKLWVFMMQHLVWPTGFSADYTLENVGGLSTSLSTVVLATVLLLQAGLATRSRIGALGVVIYWLGLATVSNFFPLHRIVADRYYYLPLAGVLMQVLAVQLMLLNSPVRFWISVGGCAVVLVPLTLLNLNRQAVFSNELALWTDCLRVSPQSATAYHGLGIFYYEKGELDRAASYYRKSLKINPDDARTHDDFGSVLAQTGQLEAAIDQFHDSAKIDPTNPKTYYNLGNALAEEARFDEAIECYQRALALDPDYALAHNGLGAAYYRKGNLGGAIAQFDEVLRLDPADANARKYRDALQALSQKNTTAP